MNWIVEFLVLVWVMGQLEITGTLAFGIVVAYFAWKTTFGLISVALQGFFRGVLKEIAENLKKQEGD